MTRAYFVYNAIVSLAGPWVAAAAMTKKKLGGDWRQRLGLMPRLSGSGPRIWVHAVSYGEVQIAATLIDAFKDRAPDSTVWLTTGTGAGRQAAGEFLGPDFPVMYLPLDVYGAPDRALRRLDPDLLVVIETELWPNLLKAARIRGVRTMLANGRISDQSIGRYRRLRFLFKEVLGYIDLMAVNESVYRDRFIALGADPDRVVVTGSAKYDRLLDRADPDRLSRLRCELALNPDGPVWVAGSTRAGEEKIVLEVHRRLKTEYPGLHLILAPRHVERAGEIEALIREQGMMFRRRSDGSARGTTPVEVTLVDVLGELFYLYGLADLAFCGGSLVPLGGQNPLEPAAWGKPVLYGPSMDNFQEAGQMLETAGAGQTVADGEGLYLKARALLADPEQARRRGRTGLEALRSRPGASRRQAELAFGLLGMDKSGETSIVSQ